MRAVIIFIWMFFSGPKNPASLLQWSDPSKLLNQEVQMASQKKQMSREKNDKLASSESLQYCEENKFLLFTQHQQISNTAKINVCEINIRMLFIWWRLWRRSMGGSVPMDGHSPNLPKSHLKQNFYRIQSLNKKCFHQF